MDFILERILPPVITLLLGIWIRGRIDKRNDVRKELKEIADRYIATVMDNPAAADEGFRLWALQTSGGAGLSSQADLETVVQRIVAHGQPSPIAGFWSQMNALEAMRWATEEGVDFRDRLESWDRFVEAFLKDLDERDRDEHSSQPIRLSNT